MLRRRIDKAIVTLMCVLGFAWAVSVRVVTAQAQPRAPRVQAVSGAAIQSPPSTPQAGYVGSDTCIACHEDQNTGYLQSVHGKAAHPRSPAAAQGCESCHGPGEAHVDDPASNTMLKKFGQMSPRDVNDTCVSCHTRASQAAWLGSPHDARNLSCITCHSVHAPKSTAAQLKTSTEGDLCATCHRVQAMKLKRVSHMPVSEGKMQCSTCHNPHGSTNVKQLRVGNWINESCVSCHLEKRGPYLFEHAAGRESCRTGRQTIGCSWPSCPCSASVATSERGIPRPPTIRCPCKARAHASSVADA
jgi:DmsE family decaheme c-type cytochrome